MGAIFYLTSLAYAGCMLLPGYLLLRAIGLDRAWSVCMAALPGAGMVALLGQLYATMGVSSTPTLVLGPLVALTGIGVLLRVRREGKVELPTITWWVPLLYVGVGLSLGYHLFAGRLITSEQVIQAYDLTEAVNLIRSMVNSGRLSSFATNFYLDDAAINPMPGTSSLYPATWHILVALAAQITGTSVPTAINASELASLGIVFPLGIAATIAAVFQGDTRHLVAGALCCLGFVIFPWVFLIFGPIYPNMAAFAAMPGIFGLFVSLTSDGLTSRDRTLLVLAFVISGVGLATFHPNAIFASAIFLAPYCVHRVHQAVSARRTGMSRTGILPVILPVIAAAGFALFACGVWYGCYRLPFFQPTVTHSWGYFTREWQELVNIATLAYIYPYWFEFAAQIPLALAVAIGIACALHDREHRWLVASYGIICLGLLLCTTGETELKHIMVGFWYCDHIRVAGIACILAIPLAVMGLVWTFGQVERAVDHYNAWRGNSTNALKVAIVCSLLFLVANFLPDFDLPGSYFDKVLNEGLNDDPPEEVLETYSEARLRVVSRKFHSVHTPFGDFRTALTRKTVSENPISEEEKAFMKEVAALVGPDAVVINEPEDGSFLAYGFENIRVYYRLWLIQAKRETEESYLIRTNLVNYAADPEVRAAVREIGAQYVMLLSEKGSETSFINLRGYYMPEIYDGIGSITPDTPGFEPVLQEGDLCLYRIVPEEEL